MRVMSLGRGTVRIKYKVKAAGTQGTAVSNCSLLAYPPQQPTLLIPTLSADKGERGQKKWLQVTLSTRVLAPGTTDRTEE